MIIFEEVFKNGEENNFKIIGTKFDEKVEFLVKIEIISENEDNFMMEGPIEFFFKVF